jgi:hypothetical protein
MALVTRQAMVDDTGPGTDGTTVSKAFIDQIYGQIDDQCHNAANPLIKPEDTTAEVVTARGTLATLGARLNVSTAPDGTLLPVAGQAAISDIAGVLRGNWVYNENFLLWAAGDAVAPTGYTLAGGGASIARVGTGLGDTNTKVGPFSVKITRAAADVTLSHNLMNPTSFSASGNSLKASKFGYGCWVLCSVGSMARIELTDGVTVSTSAFHPGDGLWHWLSTTHTVSGAATQLVLRAAVMNSAGDAYFSGLTAVPGAIAPLDWIPCPVVRGSITWKKAGTIALGTNLDNWQPARPLLVTRVQLNTLVNVAGADLICDVNVWDGAAFTSMFATRPTIAVGAKAAGQVPDGTYRYRCLTGSSGATITNSLLSWDVDQAGTSADLAVTVRAMQYLRPQDSLLDVDDF